MAYLEQSTRYIPYDTRLRPGTTATTAIRESSSRRSARRYVGEMDRMFDTYAELLPELQSTSPGPIPEGRRRVRLAYRQSVRARCLDALRGLLPAGSLSNVGIYGSGQSLRAAAAADARPSAPRGAPATPS